MIKPSSFHMTITKITSNTVVVPEDDAIIKARCQCSVVESLESISLSRDSTIQTI